MTTVLTVEPLGGNLVGGTMRLNFQGTITTGRKVLEVGYPASMSATSIDKGVASLLSAIRKTPGHLLVFAHSQGAQVVSRWLRQHGQDGVDADRVEFLLIGNPLRRYGGYGVGRKEFGGGIGLPTPTNTAYRVSDVALQYDGWADAPTKPGLPAALNAQQDRFGINGSRAIHAMGYRKATLNSPAQRTHVEGTTTYVLIPHKPILPLPQSWIEKSYDRPEMR
jgi:pimeloyl-ACP methyl ester carboxylesterase